MTSLSERNQQDLLVSSIIGVGATNIEERGLAVSHQLEDTPVHFEANESVPQAGVLFLLPFLEQTGLFSFKSHFNELKKGYYHIAFIILLIAFMYLRRIKNPEQLKHYCPGEFGKIMGIDRVPEAKCLRGKLKEICKQEKSWQWNMELVKEWTRQEDNEYYYIDGHVQVYTGHKAKLGKKHVARQKLCLPGMQEFWVNNKEGLPYFYITGEVNEKLIEMLETQIIPTLLKEIPPKYPPEELEKDPELPCLTLVFDREAYSPAFFKKLWDNHRMAVITYRKNVKDVWEESDFDKFTVDIENNQATMLLAEKTIELDGAPFREIRRLSGSHQTSVLTTNKKISLDTIAIQMFARWTQENFFKYMRQDYDFDRLLQYAVEQIDGDFRVVNPEYNNITYHLKKTREKIGRRMATLFKLQEDNVNNEFESTGNYIVKQSKVAQELDELRRQEELLLTERKQKPYKIKIEDMPENVRYNKLNLESKRFQNIIKIICYRAETSFANLLSEYYKKGINEKRALVKSIINTHADIVPDYQNNKLTVRLYSQANPKMNKAIENVCILLNETQTIYPGTDLVLTYEIAT